MKMVLLIIKAKSGVPINFAVWRGLSSIRKGESEHHSDLLDTHAVRKHAIVQSHFFSIRKRHSIFFLVWFFHIEPCSRRYLWLRPLSRGYIHDICVNGNATARGGSRFLESGWLLAACASRVVAVHPTTLSSE